MKCNQCGQEIIGHGKFCSKCGNILAREEQNTAKPLKEKKTIPIIALVIVLLALCLALASVVVKIAFNEIQNKENYVSEPKRNELNEYIKEKEYFIQYPSNWRLDETADDFSISLVNEDVLFEFVEVTHILGPIVVDDELDLDLADTFVLEMYTEMLGNTVIWNKISEFTPLPTNESFYYKTLDYQNPNGTIFGRFFMIISEKNNALVSFILRTDDNAKLTSVNSDIVDILDSLHLSIIYDNEMHEALDFMNESAGLTVNVDNVSKISDTGAEFLGKWEDTYNNSTLEFFENNTVIKYKEYPSLDNYYSGAWTYSKDEFVLTIRIEKMVIDNVEEDCEDEVFFTISDFAIDRFSLINQNNLNTSTYKKMD